MHNAKETDVATFVKDILDVWWSIIRAPPRQCGRDLSANKPMALIFFFFFQLTGMTNSHTPTQQGDDPKTDSGSGIGEW